jgi:hypothetical protein
MEENERELLKEYLMELDPCIEFDKENEDKLIGYAERFGCELIPLYQGINAFLTKTPEEAIASATSLSKDVCEFTGLNDSIVGYVVLENDKVALLHDKEILLEKLIEEYEQSDEMEEDEDYSYYTMAIEYYDYNIIGTGLSNMTTPAFACTEEWPLPIVD